MPKQDRATGRGDQPGRLKEHLDILALTYTRDHLDEHLAWARHQAPSPSDFLEKVLSEEAAHKLQWRAERRVRQSGLKERKTLEAFNWALQPKLDRRLVMELGRLDFVRQAEDLIITGKSGTGKSHILKALALRACHQQISTRYARCVDLLDDLYAGLADGTYAQKLKRWCTPALLVIDDVGLGQVKRRDDEPTGAHTLFNLIDRRHGNATTALTSNIRLSRWGHYLGDATLAAAILDRLVMRAIRLDIDGPSYRQHVAQKRAKERGGLPPDDTEQMCSESSDDTSSTEPSTAA